MKPTSRPGRKPAAGKRSSGQAANIELPMIVSEIALTLVTITALLGFDRVFIDTDHRVPLITTAVVTHVVLAVVRRLRAGVWLAMVVSAIAVILQGTQSLFADSSRFGIPTRETVDVFTQTMRDAWSDFNSVRAPTITTTGFIVVMMGAVWVIAFLSDLAAFRLRSSGQSLAPGVSIIIFTALMTSSSVIGGEVRHVMFFLAASVLFLVAHRSSLRVSTGTWLGNETNGAWRSLIGGGLIVAAVALLAGVVAGPRLPGANDEALVQINELGDSGPSQRIAESPLIDIRSRLVDLRDVEAFTVETNSPGYWRTMALDYFDGSTWTLDAGFSNADGNLESELQTDVTTENVQQEFTITGLDMDWLPAAYTATRIEVATGQKVTVERALSTLIVEEANTISGMQYTIESSRPLVTASDLQNSPPSSLDERYTVVPDDFDPRVRDLALEVTSNATDDFGRALALQDYFRETGGFSYSIAQVPPGHDKSAINSFLDSKVGYCEQFAGTFGAMARSIGLPTRIAVGFTEGIPDASNPNLYRVSGKHAHSWPEVYIEGAGWLHFEPTPGRGDASSAAYTGYQQAQVGEAEDAAAENVESLPDPTPGPGALGIETEPTPVSETPEEAAAAPLLDTETGLPLGLEIDEPGFSLTRNWWIALAGLAAAFVYAAGVPWLKRRRRSTDRLRATGTRDRVNVAWRHASHDASLRGLEKLSSETHTEFADRAAHELGLEQIAKLGDLASAAAFSKEDPPDWVAEDAETFEDAIKSILDARTSRMDKTLDDLNPKPLLTRR